MRYSLKWLLAVMGYTALIAAAFARESWVLVDVASLLAFLTFGYAALVCLVARGEVQIFALGFVVLSGLFAASAQFAPASVPTMRWATLTMPRETNAVGALQANSPAEFASAPSLGWDVSGRLWLYYDPVLLGQRTRLLNSAGTVAAGLIGGALGAVAYRRHGQRG